LLECEGGKKKSISEMDINIPAGVGHGTRIKINNTLQIIILYLQHKEFNLNGIDTIANVEIDLFTSLLGGKANVNTLSGLKNVIIPEGCQNNTKLRIRKAGMKINDTLGDHYIILNTNIPKLTNEQKELLLKIKDLGEKEQNG
jgi:DnaJ-class molecular chaperone